MSMRALPVYQIVTAGDMSANVTSSATNILYMDDVAIQANVTAASSPVGTMKVQVSIDYNQDSLGNVLNAGNWVDVANSSQAISGNTVLMYDMNQLSAPWVRLVYTRTSGSATLNAFIAGKKV